MTGEDGIIQAAALLLECGGPTLNLMGTADGLRRAFWIADRCVHCGSVVGTSEEGEGALRCSSCNKLAIAPTSEGASAPNAGEDLLELLRALPKCHHFMSGVLRAQPCDQISTRLRIDLTDSIYSCDEHGKDPAYDDTPWAGVVRRRAPRVR